MNKGRARAGVERGVRLAWFLASLFLMLLWTAPSVSAHAERTESRPAPRSQESVAPTEIKISFTEPPTADSQVSVLDGCGNDVVSDVSSAGTAMTISLAEGQPGQWKVETSVISGLDGHPTRDSWRFAVEGEPDCSVAAPEPDEGDGEDPEPSGGGFPILVVVGGAALIGLAVLARVLTSKH